MVLKAHSISKSFQSPTGPIQVLRQVDLHVHAGESVSITGQSGSGKTTLLNILAGLEYEDSGHVDWNDLSTSNRSNSWLAKQRASFLGFVFQSYYLLPELNALENITLAAKLIGKNNKNTVKRAKELLDRVGLSHRMKQLPNKLSGGEKQRIALVRAMINEPKLILGDEPTGNLDEQTGESVITTLLELCLQEHTALLLVTHNKEHAERTDRQLHLKEGVINAEG